MDASTITAWLSGIGLILKATAVLVTALRARRTRVGEEETPEHAGV